MILFILGNILTACAAVSLKTNQQATLGPAQVRLSNTATRLQSMAVSDAERTLFLQAEAFHDYRISPPARSGWIYFAEIAAATTDFPGFQSLAGSLDLLTLRLQAGDGAVLLWETLLLQYPTTRLKPWVLYRLGWAYRNSTADGLPRDSTSALTALVHDYPDSAYAALARDALNVPWKSKGKAALLSLVPGFGQGYTGHWGNGAVRFGIAATSLAMIVAPVVEVYNRQQDLTWGHDWPLLLTGLAGLIVLSVDYTQAYQDATRSVMEYNEGKEDEFELAHPLE